MRAQDKAAARLEWWQRLNDLKPPLTLPEPRCTPGPLPPEPPVYHAVVALAQDRLARGRDWLVRDSDYGAKAPPAHGAIKARSARARARGAGAQDGRRSAADSVD